MKKYAKDLDYSYTLGMSITIELIREHPSKVIEVYYTSKIIKNEYFKELVSLCARNDIPLIQDDKVIANLSVKENCYVIAYFKKGTNDIDKKKDHLVLCDIKDAGMFGTIMRTAIAFDIRDIVLIDPKIDIYEPRIVRSSMGSIFYSHIREFTDLKEYAKVYSDHHIYTYNDHGTDIHEIIPKRPYALVFGSDDVSENLMSINIKDNVKISMAQEVGIILATFYAID